MQHKGNQKRSAKKIQLSTFELYKRILDSAFELLKPLELN